MQRILFAIILLPLIAHSEEPDVIELARITGNNLALISGALSHHQHGFEEVSSKRIERIALVERDSAEYRLKVEAERAILDQTGGGTVLELFDAIRQYTDQVAGMPARIDAAERQAKVDLLAANHPLSAPTGKLDEAAKAMSELASPLSWKDQLIFLFSYASEVGDEIKALKKESDEAVKSAEESDNKPSPIVKTPEPKN
jgi:hypothetical protein